VAIGRSEAGRGQIPPDSSLAPLGLLAIRESTLALRVTKAHVSL